MSAPAVAVAGRPTLRIRGSAYPILLPTLRDPRLHLASVIVSLQILGQVAFDFRLSIAQILLSLGTSAVLEMAIAFRRQHVIMWPASALLTGNGVAFVLRVPGTEHGDWWSLRGWWIYVATAAVSLLSKHVIQLRGRHIFNPSNIGLVLCFLILGSGRAEPLDFWWAPMGPWMGIALAIIVAGGLAILSRLDLLVVAVGFWLSFAAGIGALAATGHSMTARWHLGPITGAYFWWVLVSSPEILVFLFFMITDPKTAPGGRRARIVYAVSVGLLASLLIAPMRTEFATKVAVLGALAIVCVARPILERIRPAVPVRRVALVAGAAAAYVGLLFVLGIPARPEASAAPLRHAGRLPAITIQPSQGVSSRLDRATARRIAADLVLALHRPVNGMRVHLEPGEGQGSPIAVAAVGDATYRLQLSGGRYRVLSAPAAPTRPAEGLADVRLTDVARSVGLDFRQSAFRFGVTQDTPAMMGGGLCWLDYDGDGRLDLFVVDSYSEGDIGAWNRRGGLPRSRLFHNVHGRFVDVSARSGAGIRVRGEGCVAADLDGDGHTDLFVSTASSDALLWNNGDGTFTEGARRSGVVSFGWHTGAAVADVNGDGRPDLYVAGYTEEHGPIAGSAAGFPTNHLGVRDELFLNLGGRRFREVGRAAGLDPAPFDHSLGAVFTDVNGDGRPDLYVANDEDPNRLYVNEKRGPLGFRLVDRAPWFDVADPFAGMGVAEADFNGDGRADLFVSNSRGERHAAYRRAGVRFVDARPSIVPAMGTRFAGWGASWVDLDNSGRPGLVLTNGQIPVTSLAKNAGPIQVLKNTGSGFADAGLVLGAAGGPRLNGRGLAAADFDNDGRVDVAVNSIGGGLLLLRNTGGEGHWLEVSLKPFSPGAAVTAVLPDGRRLAGELHAGSSYLSSEDPRLHFGLGQATKIVRLTVRWPGGAETVLRGVTADRIVAVER